MEFCEKSYIEFIDEKIAYGKSLVEKLERDFITIDGALKTKRNIDKDIKFLQKVRRILKVLLDDFHKDFSRCSSSQSRWLAATNWT
jgi:hypothetical protein